MKLDRKKLKTFFETGDRPTEAEFIKFIDSMIIQEDDDVWVVESNPNNVGGNTNSNNSIKKVGIGTPTPDEKLDIKGSLQLSGVINGKRTDGRLSIFSDRDTGGGYMELNSATLGGDNQGGITFVAQGDGVKNGYDFIHHDQVKDKWSRSLRIDGKGDAHATGTINVGGHIYGDKSNKPADQDVLLIGNGSSLQLYAKRHPGRPGDMYIIGDKSDNGSGAIVFSQKLGQGSWRNNMLIDTNGNVGIGESDPKNKLHVHNNGDHVGVGLRLTENGKANSAGQILASDDFGNAKWVDKTSVTSGLWQANGSNIHNGNTGNVGIGVNNPQDKLHIGGNLRVADNNIYLRGGSDLNHGVGWFGSPVLGKEFGSGNWIDGPVLFGYSGGGLGIVKNNDQSNAKLNLQWDHHRRVGVNGLGDNSNWPHTFQIWNDELDAAMLINTKGNDVFNFSDTSYSNTATRNDTPFTFRDMTAGRGFRFWNHSHGDMLRIEGNGDIKVRGEKPIRFESYNGQLTFELDNIKTFYLVTELERSDFPNFYRISHSHQAINNTQGGIEYYSINVVQDPNSTKWSIKISARAKRHYPVHSFGNESTEQIEFMFLFFHKSVSGHHVIS